MVTVSLSACKEIIFLYSGLLVPLFSTLELQNFVSSCEGLGGGEQIFTFSIKYFTGSYHCLFHMRLLVHSSNVRNPFSEDLGQFCGVIDEAS